MLIDVVYQYLDFLSQIVNVLLAFPMLENKFQCNGLNHGNEQLVANIIIFHRMELAGTKSNLSSVFASSFVHLPERSFPDQLYHVVIVHRHIYQNSAPATQDGLGFLRQQASNARENQRNSARDLMLLTDELTTDHERERTLS